MTTKIAIDGVILDQAEAKISVLDRGFLYGDSVYEVIRTYQGRPFCLPEHLQRLQRSADLLGIPLPLPLDALAQELDQTLAAAQNPESYARIIVTRGSGPIGLDPALADQPCRVMVVTALPSLPRSFYEQGIAVHLVQGGRTSAGAVPQGAKSGNYLVNIMALGAAKKRGAQEAILVDALGRVAEGASSNVFAVIDGQLCTPPLDVGILQGITRTQVMRLAQDARLNPQERELRPDDLRRAEELFITSTLREILPVTRIDQSTVGDGRPGPVTQDLHGRYQALTR